MSDSLITKIAGNAPAGSMVNREHCHARVPGWRRVAASGAIYATLLCVIPGFSSAAEDTVRGSTASTMPHPEFSPLGIHAGGFTIYPEFLYSLSYDDNVFAASDNKEPSLVSEFAPKISANSNWNNHALNFSGYTSIVKNHDFSSEDVSDWNFQTDGRIDIRHNIRLTTGVSIGHDHIDRGAPDDSRSVEPTEFDRTRYFARYNQKFGRIAGALNWSLTRKEYDDDVAIRLGVPVVVDNSDRDRDEFRLKLRLGYQYVGDEQVFIALEKFDRDYDELRTFSQRDHSSSGREISVGASFDYHGSLLGEVSYGYRTQDYKDPLPDISSPVVEATVRWNITDLTTASLSLDHSINESINTFFSGYISTTRSVSLDHELSRSFILSSSLLYIEDDYEGIGTANREDTSYYLVLGTTYRMNRYLSFNLQFTREEREGKLNTTAFDTSRFDFTKDMISFQLQAQL